MRNILEELKLTKRFVSVTFNNPLVIPTEDEFTYNHSVGYAKVHNIDDTFVEFALYTVDDDSGSLECYDSLIMPIDNIRAIWVFNEGLLEEECDE